MIKSFPLLTVFLLSVLLSACGGGSSSGGGDSTADYLDAVYPNGTDCDGAFDQSFTLEL